MDCYSGGNFEEFLVPNYQESSSETYPSTGMWGGWSMNSPEAAERCFNYDGINDGFNGGNLMYSQMGMRTSEEEEESKRSKTFYGGASSLDDFEGIEQMDDIFLSSILKDVPEDDREVHRASTSDNSVGSSSMYGGREVPMFHFHDMPFKGEAQFTISDLSEENMLDSNYEDELSSEELVLQDLQRVSRKLTDEARKCFRDTFYRLARNTQEKSDSLSTTSEEMLMQTFIYDYGDGHSGREDEIESDTNSIDRAIANLTFNQMESNISKFPLPEMESNISKFPLPERVQ